ncbi:Protein of unknown function [Roseivivax lentus]|uniref:DUF3833 domain-containing protein n=1 Tax=Roseivivax lentus TaxID=633194 RepID=A0A1N7JK05_9RHOB|nr:DUF3833 domain-containing protein [Roseivivax lentus]SIS49576.1 Protein of unknown function [Roseivivax lentus]
MSFLSFFGGVVVSLAVVWLVRRRYAFVGQKPEDYDSKSPVFDLKTHLNGPMVCEGIIYGPLGRVVSRFVADFSTDWDGDQGVMSESFVYDSGETQERAWHLTLNDDGSVIARADDIVGDGRGQQTGASMRLSYRIRLAEDAGGHVLDVVDWMYLTPNGTIINRSQFRKYGIKVAELVATMRRKEAS